jgi:hypothetical protein
MKRLAYEKICDAARSSVERFVENLESREVGRIVSCKLDEFEVDVYGRRDLWPKEVCEEKKERGFNIPR